MPALSTREAEAGSLRLAVQAPVSLRDLFFKKKKKKVVPRKAVHTFNPST